ncbi:MAG: peptidoglycan-binding protein [Bacteroidales bacterium]
MVTQTQKDTAQAIVNIFETNSVLGDYGMVTLLAGDSGHLTFGRSQTTLGSGNLFKLIRDYCNKPDARFSVKLNPYLKRLESRDLSLDHDDYFKNILRATADDPVMRTTQDEFFDTEYWKSAERNAKNTGIQTALGIAVVYDSLVHGSWQYIKSQTNNNNGLLASIGEQKWIAAYVENRRNWLANHSKKILRNTVYRMDALQRLIALEQWNLELPLVVRGQEISTVTLNATPKGCFDGPEPGSRSLQVQTPLLKGRDVRLLQLGLSCNGIDVIADGVFGTASLSAVKLYQSQNGLNVTEKVDVQVILQIIDNASLIPLQNKL